MKKQRNLQSQNKDKGGGFIAVSWPMAQHDLPDSHGQHTPQFLVCYGGSRQDRITKITLMLSAVPCYGGSRGASMFWHPTSSGARQGQPQGTHHCSSHSSVLPTCSDSAQPCALQVSPPLSEAEAGGMCCRVRSAQGSKGLPSGLPKPQPGMAGGPGSRRFPREQLWGS